MTSTIPALAIRARLGKKNWGIPKEFGPDGWYINHRSEIGKIIITSAPAPDDPDQSGGVRWLHASLSWMDHLPEYDDLVLLHKAVWPAGFAYQVFAPPSQHINIHPYALHLWGRADGEPALPNFGIDGSI